MSKWYNQDSDKTLSHKDIHIWLNFLNLHQAKLKHLYPLLSDEEKERSERFKFFKHRKLFIASHGFLHSVLAYYLKIPAEQIRFTRGEFGKPYILEQQNPDNIQFNLSHANNMAILAISKDHDVGVDIEFAERKSDWQAITRRFFTAREQKAIFSLPEDRQRDAFYKVWTRKEAHMKVTGKGLKLPSTQFEVSVPPQPAAFCGYLQETHAQTYVMKDIQLPDMYKDYHACLSAAFEFKNITQFIYA